MSSLQTAGPAINTLPVENAYYCCKCFFGPMLLELHPACIECGTPACSSCRFISLGEPSYPELQAQTGAGCNPCDAHGASLLGYVFQSNGSGSRIANIIQLRQRPVANDGPLRARTADRGRTPVGWCGTAQFDWPPRSDGRNGEAVGVCRGRIQGEDVMIYGIWHEQDTTGLGLDCFIGARIGYEKTSGCTIPGCLQLYD